MGREPIAIIGIGCRFPGAKNPEAFWQLLCDGGDAITEVPRSRWDLESFYDPTPEAPDKMNTRWGGFLEQVDQFDPQFFGIAPREAVSMDPQQRLLLEVTWEALEDAGQIPEHLAKTRTGVFIGISTFDYYELLTGNPINFDAYVPTGNDNSIAANRISYVFDFNGPSLAVGTACSSSLVAVHLACQSLWSGESTLALAGGVHVMLSPWLTVSFTKAGFLAPDGRCKTFDARANGLVRSEGLGVVVLKPWSQALVDGDQVYAVIRGSAVNQDGRSNGLTAPNPWAQEAVLREAYRQAEVSPGQVQYVEVHGTGTKLGDPMEMNTLGAVLSKDRPSGHYCTVGSVKTNIGHAEAAAGIAGLIKVALSLKHRQIPPSLHFREPNPYIHFDKLPLQVQQTLGPWPEGVGPALAGVSSFGFGGTNAHVVLQEVPIQTPTASQVERPLHVLTLSAKTENALRELAHRYQEFLANHPTVSLADVCFSANTGRSYFNHCLAVVAASIVQLREQLVNFATGRETAGLVSGKVTSSKRPQIAFLFTGQGAHYVGMGRQLYETQPTFRSSLDRCDEILRPYLEKPLLEVLYPKPGMSSPLNETAYTQPALFALEYALVELWKSWGIEPAVVMGHSVGEYVAACAAGVFSLEDGLKLIAERGRLMQALPLAGEMVAVFADEALVAAAIQLYNQEVAIAALNGPENLVISGESEAVRRVAASLEQQGIKTKKLNVSHAFHSPLMKPMLEAFKRVASEVTYSSPQIDLISNVTGGIAKEIATPEYWLSHVLEPVKFAAGMETLAQQEFKVFVEIGPKPTLLGMGYHCLPEGAGIWLPSLSQGRSDWQQMLQSLGALYVYGAPVDWPGFDRDYPRCRLQLPTYPFQRQRYWVKPAEADSHKTSRLARNHVRSQIVHPLLGQRLNLAAFKNKEILFESQMSPDSLAFLKHYRVFERATLPAVAYLEMAFAAGATVFKCDDLVVEELVIQQSLILPEDAAKTLQLILIPEGTLACSFQIFSLVIDAENEDPSWTLHAFGKVLVGDKDLKPPQADLAALQSQCTEEISIENYYRQFRERGIDYGHSFQAVERLWRSEGEALGQIRLPKALVLEVQDYKLHPVLLDACLQVLGATFPDAVKEGTYLLVSLERLQVYHCPGISLWCHALMRKFKSPSQQTLTADLRLLSPDGKVIAEVENLQLRQVFSEALLGTTQASWQNWLYEVKWRPQARSSQLLPDYLLTLSEISNRLKPQLKVYREVLTQLEALSVAYVLNAFQKMGWEFQLNQSFSIAKIAQQLGVVDQHQRLLGRLLEILAEEGILRQIGREWEVNQVPEIQSPHEPISTLLAQSPAAEAELSLLQRCGSKLAQVLRGECDPQQLLYPHGDLTTIAKLYQDSPGAQMMNTLVQKAVLSELERLPQRRGVRVLEIGAGTGGTTSYILPILSNHQTEYVFTDLSPLFIAQAQEKFQDYSFVRYQILDIEQAPETQGFGLHQYDLVVAANVLHTTKELRQTLQHIHSLLASGGMLVLLEVTARLRWVDLSFGLTEGWWRFVDQDLRPSYPLLSASQWQELLLESGFKSVVTIPPVQESQGFVSQQTVIMAQAVQAKSEVATSESGSWLILADERGIGQQLGAQLQSKGEVCILVFPGKEYEQVAEQNFKIDPASPADFQRLLEAGRTNNPPWRGVVHLWSLDAVEAEALTLVDLETASQKGCGSTLHLVQSLVKAGLSQPPSLWLVTQGAVPAGVKPDVPGVAQSPLWGMGRVISVEHPEVWGGMLDLDPDATEDEAAAMLLTEIWNSEGEDHIALRDGQRYVARLVRSSQPESKGVQLQSDSTYLITGGLGYLGLSLARWMIERGARHLVLTGRRGLPERDYWASLPENTDAWKQVKAVQSLEEMGATVVVLRADVSDLAQMSWVFEQVNTTQTPLRGIIHAAGVPGYQALQEIELGAFESILRPKTVGAWLLHQTTKDRSLDFFVCFSSTASVLGTEGLGHYGAANHFLDALAHYRRSIGLPALSINWGIADGGMASEKFRQMATKIGMKELQAEQGFEALGHLLGTSAVQTAVARMDWSTFKELYEMKGHLQQSLLDEIEVQPREAGEQQLVQQLELLQRLKEAAAGDRQEILVSNLQEQVTKVLELDSSSRPEPQQSLNELGLDSLGAIALKYWIATELEVNVPMEKFIDRKSIAQLAGLVLEQLALASVILSDDPSSDLSDDMEEITV